MRGRALTFGLLALCLGHCKTEPDFVASTRPDDCDLQSRLVRRGYPENLSQILIPGNCTAVRSPGMRGPDFSFWISNQQTPWRDCTTTEWEPRFWTEAAPDGRITTIHFCPTFCEELRQELYKELEKDVACAPEAGTLDPAATSASAGQPGGFAGAGGVTGVAGITPPIAGAP